MSHFPKRPSHLLNYALLHISQLFTQFSKGITYLGWVGSQWFLFLRFEHSYCTRSLVVRHLVYHWLVRTLFHCLFYPPGSIRFGATFGLFVYSNEFCFLVLGRSLIFRHLESWLFPFQGWIRTAHLLLRPFCLLDSVIKSNLLLRQGDVNPTSKSRCLMDPAAMLNESEELEADTFPCARHLLRLSRAALRLHLGHFEAIDCWNHFHFPF